MKERWKPIRGYEGCYEVSTWGRVRSLRRVVRYKDGRIRIQPEKIKTVQPGKNGYFMVGISKGGKGGFRYVHHLVLETFVGPRPKGMQCRHFPDRCRTNNRLENLSWGTQKDNEADKEIHQTRPKGERHGQAVLTEAVVRRIKEDIRSERFTNRQIVLKYAKRHGVCNAAIYSIIKGKTWKHF